MFSPISKWFPQGAGEEKGPGLHVIPPSVRHFLYQATRTALLPATSFYGSHFGMGYWRMPATLIATRPDAGEYDPYYDRYISLIPIPDVLSTLSRQIKETLDVLSDLTEEESNFRYAPDKWSIKELVGHVIDTEQIMAYRALRIARNDKTPIEGFEQDDYVRYGPFSQCRLKDLLEEFGYVRNGTLCLLRNLNAEAWMRRGVAYNNEISVRALAYVIAGHELHHRSVLRDRYLSVMKRS